MSLNSEFIEALQDNQTQNRRERRRFALLQAAATLLPHFINEYESRSARTYEMVRSYAVEHAVEQAQKLLIEIENREGVE